MPHLPYKWILLKIIQTALTDIPKGERGHCVFNYIQALRKHNIEYQQLEIELHLWIAHLIAEEYVTIDSAAEMSCASNSRTFNLSTSQMIENITNVTEKGSAVLLQDPSPLPQLL